MNTKFMQVLHCCHNKNFFAFVSLLFMVAIVSSCFIFTFNPISPLVSGAPDKIVNNENELRAAIVNAPNKKTFSIALNNNITLSDSSLNIPANKNIILTSNKATGYYKLVGTAYKTSTVMVGEVSVSTITVNGGVLELDGIEVTHAYNYFGYVIDVNENSQFIMHRGLISSDIGGVSNAGVFLMYGGVISGNLAVNGGGVFNRGVFRLFGGEISDNKAGNNGGGVYNEAGGTFEMSGGVISGNIASTGGGIMNYGGVTFIEYKFTTDRTRDASVSNRTREIAGYNQHEGSFTLSGGVISGNTAGRGGGVDNCGVFIMSDGLIAGNIVTASGGGVDNGDTIAVGAFEMSGGEISGNVAEKGGGVYNFFHSIASLKGGGVISGNTAELGGGVCIDNDFNMSGGVISGNTAQTGGGVYVGNGVFKIWDGKISGNTAKKSNDVYVANGSFEATGNERSDYGPIFACIGGVMGGVVPYLFFYFKKRQKKDLSEITHSNSSS